MSEIEAMAKWLTDGIDYVGGSTGLPKRDRDQRIIAYQNALRALRDIQRGAALTPSNGGSPRA